MHLESYNTSQILELLESAKNVLILPSRLGGTDTYAASCGLLQALLQKNKNVQMIYQGQKPQGTENLAPVEYVKPNADERFLEVTIDYSHVKSNKVKYNNENGVLRLHMGPVDKTFDMNNVQSRLIGFDFDLVFTLGVTELNDLGDVYLELKSELEKAKIINIDTRKSNKEFGFINVIDDTASSMSALVFNLLFGCHYTPNEKTAKALLVGMSRNGNGGSGGDNNGNYYNGNKSYNRNRG